MFTLFAALAILVRPVGVNVFAQNVTMWEGQAINNTQAVSNETNETTRNVTKGLIGVANGTGNAASNYTEGLGDAVNETEVFSNTTEGVIEGIKDVVNGSSQ
ncbi:MAG: hypothetical protein L0H53_09000 [Candidatus Nitrosocosmicus sp.]|nr:hypothetical protein [Candidatus Nitrosocosmicus sp.]